MTYFDWKAIKSKDWKTAPISPTCHVLGCDKATVAAYPAMSGGWASLCFDHYQHHISSAFQTDSLIEDGETWE